MPTTVPCPVCASKDFTYYLSTTDHTVSKQQFDLEICTSCTFLRTKDAPEADAIGRYYESDEYISHSDTKKGIMNFMYHQVRKFMLTSKAKTVEVASQLSTGDLLDIGCGTGYFPAQMNKRGWKVLGLEPDKKAREFAKSNFQIEVRASEELFQLKAKYDAVTMWHVLEHVHDLNEYIEQIHKLLENNGLFLVAVPNYTSSDAKAYGKCWAAYDVPRHLWHFSPKSMQMLVEKHGFVLKQIKSMPFDAFYVSMLSEKYRKNSFSFVRGFFKGITFWLDGLLHKKRNSSLIYLFEKV